MLSGVIVSSSEQYVRVSFREESLSIESKNPVEIQGSIKVNVLQVSTSGYKYL